MLRICCTRGGIEYTQGYNVPIGTMKAIHMVIYQFVYQFYYFTILFYQIANYDVRYYFSNIFVIPIIM